MSHIDEARLHDYLVDRLPTGARAEIDDHLRSCPQCRTDAQAIGEAATAGGLLAAPLQPSPALRARLQRSLSIGGRLSRFVHRVAELLDIDDQTAAAELDRIAGPTPPFAAWSAFPGIETYTPARGPRLARATFAFLRIQPGARFPEHLHHGDEQVLVLEGGYRDEPGGMDYDAGDLHHMAVGTSHSYVGLPGAPCICLGVVLGPIEVGGTQVGGDGGGRTPHPPPG